MDVPFDDKETLLDIYSHVSYDKGEAVIRMLGKYIGRNAFRRSLQLYLKRHEYSNTVTEDLWKAFKDAAGRDVAYMMDRWSKQKGFPLVTISQEVPHKIAMMEEDKVMTRFILDFEEV
uniref:Peptidase_M1 domain-containing protein n=1 Tax=Parastrongyloides trichosuri TaxID=131310 RepID=A0A0N4Z085_PARTI